MKTTYACLLWNLFSTSAALLAQAQQPPDRQPAPATPAVQALSERPGFWRVPIHTNADLAGYGTWAADRDFKASFHDGFVFYPRLGKGYQENLPLRWTTVKVTAGGEPIADLGRVETVHTDSRYEYRFAGVTEAYDVRSDGVEQTFVIASRPAVSGDLVVEGRIETQLVPVGGAPAAHGDLVFGDAQGVPLVQYGRAFAVDALGNKTEVATHLSGASVQLRVPAQWLAGAVFPVTVDPLTSRVSVAGGVPGSYPEFTAVHTEGISPVNNTMIAFERVFSATDIDAYAYLASDDLSVNTLVMVNNSTTYALRPDVSFVVAADRWLVSVELRGPIANIPAVYFHPRNDTRFGIGFTRSIPAGSLPYVLPSVAGSLSPTSSFGLLVFESYSATANSSILACPIDAANGSFGTVFPLTAPSVTAQEPDVNCQADATDNGWVVTYTAKTSATDDYDIYVTRVQNGSFTVGNTALIGPDAENQDKVHPVISGQGGRYMVAMLQDVEARVGIYFGRHLWKERIDWSNTAALPTEYGPQRVTSTGGYYIVNHHLAFNEATRSHWCLVYDFDQGPTVVAVTSLYELSGYKGGQLEGGSIDGGNNRYSPSVAWNPRRNQFPLVFCQIETVANGVYGLFVRHTSSAVNVTYGTGCGPATLTSQTLPYTGSEFYQLTLANAPASQPAALWLSAGSANVQLGGYGAPSCFLNVGALITDFPFSTGASGNATFTIPLPDKPLFRGDVFWQAVYVWQSSPNPTPIGLTNGLRSVVR